MIDDDDPEDRFELLEEVGRGSYGVVFAARDAATGGLVAVKIIPGKFGVNVSDSFGGGGGVLNNGGGGGFGYGDEEDDDDDDSDSDSEEEEEESEEEDDDEEDDDDCLSEGEHEDLSDDEDTRRTSVVGGALNLLGKKVAAVAAAAREKQGRAKRRAERAREKEARKREKEARKKEKKAAAAAAAAAAAKPPKPSSNNNNNQRPQIPRSAADAEASALRGAASHGCVVGVVGAWRSRRSLRGDLWLVMELCDGGSVADALALMGKKGGMRMGAKGKSSSGGAGKNNSTQQQLPKTLISASDVGPAGGLTEAAIARVVGGALAGIAHIHASGKAHRDIKCGNLLLTAGGDVKVADFGVAGEKVGGDWKKEIEVEERKLFAFFFLSSSLATQRNHHLSP